MARDEDFQVRPGRIRSSRAQRTKPFIAQALAATQKAGGRIGRDGSITGRRGSRFGRGRVAAVQANRLLTSRSRGAVVKGRFLRHATQRGKLAAHLGYLRREGVTRDGEKAKLFGPETSRMPTPRTSPSAARMIGTISASSSHLTTRWRWRTSRASPAI